MAVPALPANLAYSDVAAEAWFDDTRAMLAFLRDGRPRLQVGVSSGDTFTSGTNTQPTLSSQTPTINTGGWNTTGVLYRGWNVPETGDYLLTASARFAVGASGYRQLQITAENVAMSDGWVRVAPTGASSITGITTSAIHRFTAGDELSLLCLHTQGSDLTVTTWLNAVWIGS